MLASASADETVQRLWDPATGFRHDAVGVGFSLVARTLLVFTGADHVIKGSSIPIAPVSL